MAKAARQHASGAADQLRTLPLGRETAAGDEAARVRLAAAADTSPELLFFLAGDQEVSVRAAVAMNHATPAKADARLAEDADERIRVVLAGKLSGLAPGMEAGAQTRAAAQAWDNLHRLVRDEAVRVRATVADLLKQIPNAPHALILELASDTHFSVSDPVLRLSPVLTEEDLLTLMDRPGAEHVLQSIARRPDLQGDVCDAVVRTACSEPIRVLLANSSAQIREATLDRLVGHAAGELSWHEPLTRRPSLSPYACAALSRIVTGELADVLAIRADIPAAVREELQARMEHRVAPPVARGGNTWVDLLMEEARAALAGGTLTEELVVQTIRASQTDRLTALLAVGSENGYATVRRAGKLRSARAMVSLAWKAGLPMRIAVPIQAVLCSLPPNSLLRPKADGGYPLTEEEMRWQMNFVASSPE